MPRGKFTFHFDNYETLTSSEFEVNKDVDTQTVIEAFAEFLKLTGFVYDPEEDN